MTMTMRDDVISDAEYVEGKEKAAEIIDRWIRPRLEKSEQDELLVQLFQKSRGSGEVPVESFEHFVNQTTVEETIERIVDAADSDARKFGQGKTNFIVRIDGQKQGIGFSLEMPYAAESKGKIDRYGQPEEYANEGGLVSQAMRFAETFANTTLEAVRDSREDLKEQFRLIASENKQLLGENKKLRGELNNVYALREKLLDMTFEREHQRKKLEREEERKDKVIDLAGKVFGPIVAMKLLGPGGATLVQNLLSGGGTPGAPGGMPGAPDGSAPDPVPPPGAMPSPHPGLPMQNEDERLIDKLFATFNQEQLFEIGSRLRPEQVDILMQIHERVVTRQQMRAAAEAAARAANNAGMSGAGAPAFAESSPT